MRVALITDLPFWYSKTMYLNELEKRMVQNGIDVKVFVVEPRFFKKIDLHTGIVRFLNVALLLKTLSDFDLLHINFTHLAFTFLFFRSLRLFNKPIIIHTHGFDVFTVPEISYGFRLKMVGQVFTAYSWKRANRIIAVCKKAKSEIENAGIGSEKVDVIY